MAVPDVGTGAALTFQSGFGAKITGMSVNGYEVPVIDVPTMSDTDVHTRLFGQLRSPPVLAVEVLLDQEKDIDAILAAAPESVTITFPIETGHSTGATWVFTGKATSFEADIPVEDAMTGTLTITATSKIAVTAGTGS